MSETYLRLICVAGTPEAAVAVRAALDGAVATSAPGTIVIGEFPPNASAAVEASPSISVELERLRQAAALGGIASRWRHTLNNSLAALLAEAQLLGMESLQANEHEGVERIIAQCRRMIVIVRDGPSVEPGDAAP